MSPALTIRETRELLAEQYRMTPPPDPSCELLARMQPGPVITAATKLGHDDVLVPLTPRRAPRRARLLRYLVAATAASALAMSGLTAVGALPASLQRDAAAVASVLALDLPTPAANPTPHVRAPQAPRPPDHHPTVPTATSPPPPMTEPGAVATDREPGASEVDAMPDQTNPPLANLPIGPLPNLALPAVPPPVPSITNGALPIIPQSAH